MSNKIEYKQKSIISIVEEAYANYGTYVNLNRFIPNSLDGLKPSFRKAIYATMKVCKTELAGVDSVIGEVLKYYNHGGQHIVPVLCKLSKYGILRDDGANGAYFLYGDNVGHAASRYLETGVNDFYYQLFSKLIKYVPYITSDKGHPEPEYIPTPIPLGLTFGYNAISCGTNTEIPPFTAKSLTKALSEDDPKFLKMSFGLELVESESNLEGIWRKGAGKLVFRYPWRIEEIDGVKGIVISGNPVYHNLEWGNDRKGFDFNLDKLIERNVVEVFDLPKQGEIKSIFIKIKKSDQLSIEDLASYVNTVVTNYKLVKLSTYVTSKDGRKFVTRLSLRSWLALCFDNYIKLLNTYKTSNIENLKRNRTILEWLPKVAEILLQNKDRDISDKEIAEILKIEEWIVTEVVKKPINALRKKDTAPQIKAINDQIKEFESFNPERFTIDIINQIPE